MTEIVKVTDVRPAFAIVSEPIRGRHMLAARPIGDGEVILVERPLVACQFAWNRHCGYKACDHCLRPLETLDENLSRLLHQPICVSSALNADVSLECHSNSQAGQVRCPHCDVSYCSATCQQQAWLTYHQLLCAGFNSAAAECRPKLEEVWRKMHYPPETTTVFLIVRILAMLKLSDDLRRKELLQSFERFCSQTIEQTMSHKLLGAQFEENLKTLSSELSRLSFLFDPLTQSWSTVEGLQSLFALMGRNGQGIGTSPLSVWTSNVENSGQLSSETTKREFGEFLDRLYAQLEESTGLDFLNSEGVGLYASQSAINHSCFPNAQIRFQNGDSLLTLVALQPIKENEEILISYLDECELSRSRHSRRKKLQENYLFSCDCPKCQAEVDQPDVTSEEEDDSDDDDSV